MFRLFGILAVIAGSSGLAFSIVGERKEYLERCRQWREVITLMEHEIAFQKSSLPEICSRVGMHLTGDKKVFWNASERPLTRGMAVHWGRYGGGRRAWCLRKNR